MHEVLVNRLGGLSLPRKSVVRLTDRPDMSLDVYRGRNTTMQQQQITLFISNLSTEKHQLIMNKGGDFTEVWPIEYRFGGYWLVDFGFNGP